jgi:serine/threonine protein kinase
VIAAAGDIKSIDVSDCGVIVADWSLPSPFLARLFHIQDLRGIEFSTASKLLFPPAQVCSGGIERIKKFLFHSEQKDLEGAAVSITSMLDSSSATVAPVVVDIIDVLWKQGQQHAPLMAQQLWVSLVSHKSSDEYTPLVDKFLDRHLDGVSEVMKWKDHSGRTAAATALSSCKRAMSSRSFFMGVYDIPDGVQHEYKSATCTVYIVDRVEDDKRTRVALKFMKNADEFEREKTSREKLLAPASGEAHMLQDCIIDATDSYHCTDAAFCAAVEKRRGLVDYDRPCLLVMPAADRNLRAIMDNERITEAGVIKAMFHEILNCAKFMHERSYIHGDLKPRNVMRIHRDHKRLIMLIDLDASASIGLQYAWSKHSSAYMPPEAIRFSLSVICSDLAVGNASGSAQCTVCFKGCFPFGISSGSTFTISISSVIVTAVHSLTLDDVDLSSCVFIKDGVITVTSKDTISAGDRRFKIAITFDGNLPAADSMSARVEHVVDTLRPMEGASKDSLAKCTVSIRNPLKEAMSMQPDQQLSSSEAPSALTSQHSHSRPESSSRPLQPPPPVKRNFHAAAPLKSPCPPFLAESAIASISPDLPPLPDVSLSPAVAEAAALIQIEYTCSAANAKLSMSSMRDAWISWQRISAGLSGMRPPSKSPTSPAVLSSECHAGNDPPSSVESGAFTTSTTASSVPLQNAARDIAPHVPCECTCDKFLLPGMRSGDASIPAGCIGLCGLAHVSHDMWALGVILYRLSARESLLSEDDEDNIKSGTGHLLELALWTDAFKEERLQKIDDTATRELVSKLLEKDPWKRPRSIDDVLAMSFNEMDVIKLKLQQTVLQDSSASNNLVGSLNDLVTGKFSHAAYGLRHFLKVADDWNEEAACTLPGMQHEVDVLKDCPDCAQVQAGVLQQLKRGEADATLKLAAALSQLKDQRKHGTPVTADGIVKVLRTEISTAGGWHYGLEVPSSIEWPKEHVQVGFTTFKQPMCKGCQDYCLDYSSIVADLHYITDEETVEKKFWNGVRDLGRKKGENGWKLADFMAQPQAKDLLKEELIALRFYTSHSFNSINVAMRDQQRHTRSTPHPLPGIVTNIQRGLKKLRALGSADASSKETVVLWRGMSGLKLPDQFSAGGTELAPMSTTTDVSVAVSYAVKKDTRYALLFRFVTRNNLERGADVQWLSMFPGESETLFPPLTFLQRTRTEPQEVVHNGVKVTVVELSTTLA